MVKERYQQLEEQSRVATAAQQRPVMLPSVRSFSYEMPTHVAEMEAMSRAESTSPPPLPENTNTRLEYDNDAASGCLGVP